ncbi:MAG: cytochrome-c peroxidase [Planctomycetota bacterium]
MHQLPGNGSGFWSTVAPRVPKLAGTVLLVALTLLQTGCPGPKPVPNLKMTKTGKTAPAVCATCGSKIIEGQSDHRCQSAPLTHAQLEQRKADAHSLSAHQSDEWHLSSDDQPQPAEWIHYVRSDAALVALGKALFWDLQLGSDNRTACATCHHHGGVDQRIKNTVTDLDPAKAKALAQKNRLLKKEDHHPWVDDDSNDSNKFGLIVGDSTEVIGSQGVRARWFDAAAFYEVIGNRATKPNDPIVETGTLSKSQAAPAEQSQKPDLRQVTGRQTITNVNSSRLARMFHDGRAEHVFNGYDPFGSQSPFEDQLGKYVVRNNRLERVKIAIPQLASASQAVGPIINSTEMSYKDRTFAHVAIKLLDQRALLAQTVSEDDSVLAQWRQPGAGTKGLQATYRELIRLAFQERFWKQENANLPQALPAIPDNITHKIKVKTKVNGEEQEAERVLPYNQDMMVANFSLYVGLAIAAYEKTLISDDSPFDRYMSGDVLAMTAEARRGMARFISLGCAECHLLPEFGGPSMDVVFGDAQEEEVDPYEAPEPGLVPLPLPINPSGNAFIEQMLFRVPVPRYRAYDNLFYNIGVTGLVKVDPNTKEPLKLDWGVGRWILVEELTKKVEGSDDTTAAPVASVAHLTPKDAVLKARKNAQDRVMELEKDQARSATAEEDPAVQRLLQNPRLVLKNDRLYYRPSYAEVSFPNQDPHKHLQSSVKGAFKTPSLRNVALTAPYMHNGAFLTLQEVIRFYRYGPRTFAGDTEAKNFHHPGLEELRTNFGLEDEAFGKNGKTPDDESQVDADLIAFLESLTDSRVQRHAAPFDHPSLDLPHGNIENPAANSAPSDWDDILALPAIGQGGYPQLPAFLESFQRLNNDSSKPAETKPAETKPAATKPAETK